MYQDMDRTKCIWWTVCRKRKKRKGKGREGKGREGKG